jgi:hypothetical protein
MNGKRMDYWLHRINRNIGKTNSLQIIVLAIAIHSCISIVMIYYHLVNYFDTHFRYYSFISITFY